MDQPTPTRRRGKTPPPQETALAAEKDTRENLTLFRVEEDVTLTPHDRFVVLPGDKGRGWILKVFPDPPEPEATDQTG